MPPEIAQWIVPLIVIFGTLSPAVIIAIMLYLHRSTHRRLDRLETQVGDLRDRMGRVEGTLTALRDFFVRNGRGTAA